MRISAVITTYNYAHVLDASAGSALTQTEPCEVVVVDDGSTDDTAAVIERLRRTHARRELRYLRIANAGPSAARNAGVRIARGDWVAFLDADDYWYPHKLAAQTWFATRHKDAALVFSGVDLEGADGYRRRRLPPREGRISRSELLCENWVPSPTPLVRRDVLTAVGGFDERRRYGEDWDAWLRIAEDRALYAQRTALACYRDHAGGLHRKPAMGEGSRSVLAAALARVPVSGPVRRRALAALEAASAAALAADGRWGEAVRAGLGAMRRDVGAAPALAAGFAAAALHRGGM